MADKLSAHGTLLQVNLSSVYTAVGSLMSIDFPDGEVQFFEANSLDAGATIEDGELVGQSTPGGMGGELFYDPLDVTHNVLARDHAAGGAHRDWKIVIPATGSPVVTFSGSVQSFVPKAALKDGLKAQLKIKLRTLATYPAAS